MNLDLSEPLARQVLALLQFYGGRAQQSLSPLHTTHAFSTQAYTRNAKLPASVKLVTPDWLIDSIRENRLLDELCYDPGFLLSHRENREILEKATAAAAAEKDRLERERREKEADLLKSGSNKTENAGKKNLNFVIIPQSMETPEPATKPTKKRRNEEDGYDDDDNDNDNDVEDDEARPSKTTTSEKTTSKGFSSLDMDEIFASVIASAEKNKAANIKPCAVPTTSSPPKLAKNLNDLKPVSFDIMKPNLTTEATLTTAAAAMTSTASLIVNNLFEVLEEMRSTDERTQQQQSNATATQENAHLLQFDCLLLGCVFYIGLNESMFDRESVESWKVEIARYAGKCVDSYEEHRSEITHVLAPARTGEVYEKAVADKKRICTVYWLEDVLQEQKLRQPWLAYHFPSAFGLADGPLSNHVRRFKKKEKSTSF